MTELRFIPQWLGEWADRNPNFRNFPVFAAFAFLLFFVFTRYLPPVIRNSCWRRALSAFIVTSTIGVLLELAQILIPSRVADWHDVVWTSLGALAGALSCALLACIFRDMKAGRTGRLGPRQLASK